MYLGLVALPSVCGREHPIVATTKRVQRVNARLAYDGCKHANTGDLEKADWTMTTSGRYRTSAATFCKVGARRSWRSYPPICGQLTNSVQPPGFAKLLYWFAQRSVIQTVSHECNMASTIVRVTLYDRSSGCACWNWN